MIGGQEDMIEGAAMTIAKDRGLKIEERPTGVAQHLNQRVATLGAFLRHLICNGLEGPIAAQDGFCNEVITVPDEPKIGVGQEFPPGIWPSPQTLSSAAPLFILAYQVLKFPCHFVAHQSQKIAPALPVAETL
jgi:hypothetical protein